jgi:dihydrofolate reductase
VTPTVDIYMTLAINGLIAKPDDKVTWSKELWPAYFKLVREYDAVICGYKSFSIMQAEGEIRKMGNPPVIVLTTRKRKLPEGCIAAATPKNALYIMKQYHFNNALVVGGAKAVTAFIEAKLTNKFIVDIEPQLYGQGINLINAKKPWVKKLKFQSVKTIAKKIVRLTYKI